MKRTIPVFFLAAALWGAAEQPRTFTGIITDSMCGKDHQTMKIAPDSKCAIECVKAGGGVKFSLNDGKNSYKLSDQSTPAKFAGQKVKVTGVLFEKTAIIQVTSIEAAK